MHIESRDLDTESDDEDPEEQPDDSDDPSVHQTIFYDRQDPADSPQSLTDDTDSIYSPSVRAPRIITPAASKPPDTNPQLATNTPSPTPVRSALSRRAATRARIATKKVQQLESEDDIDDDSEYEHEHTHPHPVVQTMDELPSEDDHQVDDEYDQLDDDTAPKKRKIKPSNKSSKKRKITERFRCTIPGCTKTFTRKNDVTRHIRASGAPPTTRSSPTASSVKFAASISLGLMLVYVTNVHMPAGNAMYSSRGTRLMPRIALPPHDNVLRYAHHPSAFLRS